MTRLALISDIHGNLPALEAVLADIGTVQGVAATYHLGDLVGYAPWPNEVVALLAGHGIAGVGGNYDSTVAARYTHCGCRYEDPRQEALAHLSYAWTLAQVTEATRRALAALPFRLDLMPQGGHAGGRRLILVHGTPTLNTVYWTEDRPEAFDRKMIGQAGARPGDVLAFGHTHKPWSRTVDGVTLVNTGSVGRPKDHDPRAAYVLLDFEGSGTGVTVRRVAYDVARAAAAIRASTLPDEFACYLESGGARLE